ncbi:hypothetical protein WJX73_005722 [Symbiochloris irregularis]|uniref:Ubiquitin-like protease family profile domain-containing protein n=1 Tax=Symbiochloris irregularis TaxID=706552 RepID=A0AAW1P001_9CHLO
MPIGYREAYENVANFFKNRLTGKKRSRVESRAAEDPPAENVTNNEEQTAKKLRFDHTRTAPHRRQLATPAHPAIRDTDHAPAPRRANLPPQSPLASLTPAGQAACTREYQPVPAFEQPGPVDRQLSRRTAQPEYSFPKEVANGFTPGSETEIQPRQPKGADLEERDDYARLLNNQHRPRATSPHQHSPPSTSHALAIAPLANGIAAHTQTDAEATPSLQELYNRAAMPAMLEQQQHDAREERAQRERTELRQRLQEIQLRGKGLLERATAAIAGTTSPKGKPAPQHDESALVRETAEVLQRSRPSLPQAAKAPSKASSKARGKLKAVPKKPSPAPVKAQQQQGVVDLMSSSDDEDGDSTVVTDKRLTGAQQVSSADGESEGDESSQQESDISEAMDGLVLPGDRPSGPKPLTRKQRAAAERALSKGGNPDEVLVHHQGTNIEITRKMISCLLPRIWLNDEIMNVYVGLLQDRDSARRKRSTSNGTNGARPTHCHFFSSFFVNKLYKDEEAYNYKNVRRWTSPAKLKLAGQMSECVLQCDRIILPVHLGMHWTCAVIDLKRRELLYYDSMKGREPAIMDALRQWVADEFTDKLKQELDTSRWPIRYPDCPQQYNGCDCGVFALTFANYSARDAPMTFSQKHMELLRLKMASDIVHLALS